MKKITIIWCISLFVIGIGTVILAGSEIAGIELPDIASRIIGIVDLCALPVMVYTTVKRVKK